MFASFLNYLREILISPFFVHTVFISVFVALTRPYLYKKMCGTYPKKPFIIHSNIYFRYIASVVSAMCVILPAQLGVSVYVVLPLALIVNLGLQIIADDYIV